MKMERQWAMPNKNTFDIRPIRKFIEPYIRPGIVSIDPFANSNKIASITNDLDPQFGTDFNMDALAFLKTIQSASADLVLFDPPYSPRQVSECYKQFGMTVNMETTQASFWSNMKIEISRIVRPNGHVLSFGWNSNGIGKTRGFEIEEILIVAHGGHHNDTICMAERRFTTSMF
jgi:hypothetical protein